jgi:hypothetical protein
MQPSPQLSEGASPRGAPYLCADEAGNIYSVLLLPSVLLLLRQGRVAAGSSLGNGLGTTIKYVRRATLGAAGNDLGATNKYL